jgi:hypothetical protein
MMLVAFQAFALPIEFNHVAAAMPAIDPAALFGLAMAGTVKTERDLEYFLRDSGQYSKSRAMALIAKFKSIWAAGDHQPDVDLSPILKRIQNLAK